MNVLQNKRVVVIGASKGIGYHTAIQFAEHNAKLVLVARGEEQLRNVFDQRQEFIGYIQADISVREDCKKILQQAKSMLGGVDILINNAALHHRGMVGSRTPDELADMVQTNLTAPIYLSRLFLEELCQNKGTLINIASLAGCVPLPHAATYSATKFGLRAFSLALRQEVAQTGMKVCLVSPGPVATEFILGDLSAVSDMTLSQPMMTPQQVATAIINITSRDRAEVKLPYLSGKLTTLGYVFPFLHRQLKPWLQKKGARRKQLLQQSRNKNH